MRRPLALLIACLAVAAALVASGCGDKTVTTTGSNGQTTTRTVPNVHFAKTKFLLHSGLAFGSLKHWIITPYSKGAFKKGAPGRTKALVKAAAAGTFSINELRLARNAALSDDKLRSLGDKLGSLSSDATALVPALTSGSFNPAKIAALGGSVATIAGLAKKAGLPITDQLPPGLGG